MTQCSRCNGKGYTSAHLGSFTMEEFYECFDTPEDRDEYLHGGYDKPCERCHGTGKVTEEDAQRWEQRRADLYLRWCESGCPEGSFDKWAGV